MCYKELWQKQKAEKEKKWIDNHKGADVAWCSQELIPTLHGREGKLNIFFNRKEKIVTQATVLNAFNRARQIQKDEGCVSGPKKLGTFGASYLYPVFLRIGVCTKKS